MNIFEWVENELRPASCSSTEFIYDNMDSQSDYCLPLIYKPFDVNNRSHWSDRGWVFDYLYATGGGKLLDFGPGDGWPSLIVAPYVKKVIGLDGSRRRVEVCTKNGKRMKISNAEFVYSQPGEKFPFKDRSFDGIMAASSVEETNNPQEILNEFYRILRPGGRLRIFYDGLNKYKNGKEHDLWLQKIEKNNSLLILSNRRIDKEQFDMYGLSIKMSEEKIKGLLSDKKEPLSFDNISIEQLEKIRSTILETKVCSLPHPSGRTLCNWLKEAGFQGISPTHNGGDAAGKLYDLTPEKQRPKNIEGVDRLVRPLAQIAVNMQAPIKDDPVITAVKSSP